MSAKRLCRLRHFLARGFLRARRIRVRTLRRGIRRGILADRVARDRGVHLRAARLCRHIQSGGFSARIRHAVSSCGRRNRCPRRSCTASAALHRTPETRCLCTARRAHLREHRDVRKRDCTQCLLLRLGTL